MQFGNEFLSKSIVWYRFFKEGRIAVENKVHVHRSKTSTGDDKLSDMDELI